MARRLGGNLGIYGVPTSQTKKSEVLLSTGWRCRSFWRFFFGSRRREDGEEERQRGGRQLRRERPLLEERGGVAWGLWTLLRKTGVSLFPNSPVDTPDTPEPTDALSEQAFLPGPLQRMGKENGKKHQQFDPSQKEPGTEICVESCDLDNLQGPTDNPASNNFMNVILQNLVAVVAGRGARRLPLHH